ncbi:hypothetical protein Pelo_13621 [Pelomyxa schiedti]|nr:hypothetical protein Pelo_13621 [Pelomyxa schiedti]
MLSPGCHHKLVITDLQRKVGVHGGGTQRTRRGGWRAAVVGRSNAVRLSEHTLESIPFALRFWISERSTQVLEVLECGCTVGMFSGWQAILLLVLEPLGFTQSQPIIELINVSDHSERHHWESFPTTTKLEPCQSSHGFWTVTHFHQVEVHQNQDIAK